VQVPVLVKTAALLPDKALLLMLSAAEPVLEMVSVRPALVVPTNWLPKERLLAESPMIGAAARPVPDRLTETEGVPEAVEAMARVAVLAPVVVGLKVRLMVQLAPAASVEQALEAVNAEAPVPVTLRPVIWKLVAPALLTVRVWALLVVLIGLLAKDRLVGLIESDGATVNVCKTSVAAKKTSLPAWDAVMVHDPGATRLSVLPFTLQMPVVPAYVTVRPDELVAVSKIEPPETPESDWLQVMACAPFATENVIWASEAAM
jgi:hypothetical protein